MVEPVELERTLAIVLNRDLMFGSQIRSALDVAGLQGRFTPDTARFVAAIESAGDAAAIAILDMNGPVAWAEISAAIQRRGNIPPTLAFGPHVEIDARRAAKAAGVTRIVSNGQFHNDAVELIERYRRR